MKNAIKTLLLISTLPLLQSCGISEMFGSKVVNEPTELSNVENRIAVNELWTQDFGAGADGQDLHLLPSIDGDRLFAADSEGQIIAIDKNTGATLWQVETGEPVTGGPGSGSGLVLIGTANAEVIAYSQSSGEEVWRKRVSSEVLSAPVASLDRVMVHTLDGKIIALNARDGESRWTYERKVPTLSLRGSSSPVVSGTLVICGLAGGRLVALEIDSGDVAWNNVITVPSGRSQIERLSDIDGDPIISKNTVFASTYQGEVAAIGEFTGTLLWKRKLSAYERMASDGVQVYVADEDGDMWALDMESGSATWKQEALRYRNLSSVAVISGIVVVGDFDGYLHFFSARSGAIIARTRVGSAAITSGMVVNNNVLYVQNDDGTIKALTVSSR